MARTASMETLDKKIEKAEAEVAKAKQAYEAAAAELKQLQDKKNSIRREEVVAAILKSSKSYDEILDFVNGTAKN